MTQKSWLEKKVDLWQDNAEFLTEEKILEFTECVVLEMERRQINRAQLAEALGKSKPFVTKLLKGDANMTVKTMVAIAQALGCSLHIGLFPKGFTVKSFSVKDNFKPIQVDYTKLETLNACAA